MGPRSRRIVRSTNAWDLLARKALAGALERDARMDD
jgi:hypothetical protein